MIRGISQQESELIGFVLCTLNLQAISIDEFQKWVFSIIEQCDELPTYFYFLQDGKEVAELEEIVGFFTSSKTSSEEKDALIGISFLRDLSQDEEEWGVSKRAALNALKRNPQVVKRFHETFPFIELNDDLKALLAQAE